MIQHNSNNLNRKIGKAKWTAEKMLNMLRVLQMYMLNEKKTQQKKCNSHTITNMETYGNTHAQRDTHRIKFSQPV